MFKGQKWAMRVVQGQQRLLHGYAGGYGVEGLAFRDWGFRLLHVGVWGRALSWLRFDP